MKIYIPEHLKKLEIIDQLEKLLIEYSSNYYVDSSNSFDDYLYSLKNDPVKKFLSLCIPKDSINENEQVYEDIINYLYRLFYSVKGTIKVFDYMKKYLNLEFDGDIIYTTRYVELKLKSISVSDENLFYESMKEFLDSLLYFHELNTSTDSIDLILSGTIDSYIGSGIITYKEYTSEIYEDNNS